MKKETYLTVLQLELAGFEISVDTRIYELVQNKGFKAIGYPSHKKHSNDYILSGCGSITDFNIPKEAAYVKVSIEIIGKNIR